MNSSQDRNLILILTTLLTLLLIAGGCANIGTPSGGPRDEDPPILVTANPAPGALNVDRNRITLTFNELVNVKDAFSKVVVSPVSKSVPRVTSSGRNVNIEFDSLAPNTTYTVDFADAIEDNNEGNKLTGFTYSFSTGETIDTLRIAGRVLDARNLEPRPGILVGVHSNLNDTAFTGQRFLRVAKTDDRGTFTVRGLAPGNYRVFALEDKDNDYRYSTPEEDLAFYDLTVSPTSRQTTASDTVYNELTGLPDTVLTRSRTQYLPNDIILRTFNSGLRQQYMTKYERLDSTRIYLKFNTKAQSLPEIRIIGRENLSSLGTLEASEKLDSLVWWLTPELMRKDSLQLEVSYNRTDQNLVSTFVSDTLNFITKRLPVKKKDDKKNKKPLSVADSIAGITMSFNIRTTSVLDVDKPFLFESPVPLSRFDTTAVRLYTKVDTLYVPVTERYTVVRQDSLNPRSFRLDYPWDYETKYKVEIDSLAATDIYGKPSRPISSEFSTKAAGEYCSLLFHLTGLGDVPAFVELLNSSDAVTRVSAVGTDGDAYFPFLQPGKYYARVILDFNGNGEYDTGSYTLNRQPELAYYYPKAINLKKNWDKEEQWAVFDIPVDMMKPLAITKNKPKTDRRAKSDRTQTTDDEEEEYFDPTRNPFDPNDRGRRR